VDSVIPARHRISVKVPAEGATRVFPSDLSTASHVILRGTREVGIADLKPWELLYVSPNANGVDWSFTVVDRKATGTLEVVQTSGTTVFNVRVGGTNYSVSSPAQVSTNNGDTFFSTFAAEAGKLIGEQVTVYLDHSGDVVYMVGDARGIGAAGNFGQVVKVNPTTGVVGANIGVTGIASVELLLANGTKATYPVDGNTRIDAVLTGTRATRDGDTVEAFNSLARGEFVEFRLRADGRVDRMAEITDSVTLTTANVDTDNNRINIGGNWFQAGGAVVFNVTGTDVERIANWSMVEDSLPVVFYVTSGNQVTHLAVSAVQLGAAVNYAVVMETGTDRDGLYVRLMDSKGAITRYDAEAAQLAGIGFRSVVNFTATGGKLTGTVHEVVYDTRAENTIATITAIDRTGRGAVRLEIGTTNTWYFIDSDTVIYNLAGTPRVITLADLAVGDQVVYRNLTVASPNQAQGMIEGGNFNFLAIRNP